MTPDQLRMGLSVLLVLGLSAIAIWRPRIGDRVFHAIERFGAGLARRKFLAIASIALAAIVLRLAILALVPVPIPEFHDEFSYLLAADTFTHGRLTNPAHPLWLYFDTMHVNQLPTYMSKYPPAQGFALAVGEILGLPWLGVLLSVAAMASAVTWALQGWLPPPWALLGGALVLLRLGLFGYWINSYWGGAMAVIGGALVIGALPRIVHSLRASDALILGLGEAILANSRPFEGLVFSVPVLAYLLIALPRRHILRREIFRGFVVPFASVMLLCTIFMGYYNWRGTGHPLSFPYSLNDRLYQSQTPALLWEKASTPKAYDNPQFDAFYNGWNYDAWREGRADSLGRAFHLLVRNGGRFVRFFMWPELCVPLLAALWILRDHRVRFLVVQTVICFGGFLLVAWFIPHYAAPVLATVFALLTQGMRHLRKWTWRGRPVGVGLTRAVALCAILLAPFHNMDYPKPGLGSRARIAAELSHAPGKQLVIVHYSPQHYVHAEWVYNRADIDDAKIVWAREIPGVSLTPLLDYFRSRQVWIVDADSPSPEPRKYSAHLEPGNSQ